MRKHLTKGRVFVLLAVLTMATTGLYAYSQPETDQHGIAVDIHP